MGITKEEIKRRQDEEDAQNRIFFLYEFVQRAGNGGSPVPNEANLNHGEPVYVVKKRELMEFMAGVRSIIDSSWETQHTARPADVAEALAIIDRVLAKNQFVAPLRKFGTPKDGNEGR